MSIELKNLYKAGVIDQPTFAKAQLVLRHEHHIEEVRDHKQKNGGFLD